MIRHALRASALLALAATAAAAQSSQDSGLHVKMVSSPAPGAVEVLLAADAPHDSSIGAKPAATDFTLWLEDGAAPGLSVARNGGRGKPMTTVILLDESGSYKADHGAKVAVPAIYDYGKDAGTDELALIVFSLDVKAFPMHQGPADFMTDVSSVGARRPGQGTSVTIGLTAAIELAAREGEPGLREVVLFTDAGDEAEVAATRWAEVIARAQELGVRVSVVLPTDDKKPQDTKHEYWVNTRTHLNNLAAATAGTYITSWDPVAIGKTLRDARAAVKNWIVLDGKLCGAKRGQPVDVRVEYVPGAQRKAWSAGSKLAAEAWAPGSDTPCPSLCTVACDPWQECIGGTCAARSCSASAPCLGGATCTAGVCEKACTGGCASWQECHAGTCEARACTSDEMCGVGSRCTAGTCTLPVAKKSSILIWILAAAGILLLLAALAVLLRKKPPAPVVVAPAPAPPPVEAPVAKEPATAGVDLDPLPETHLVAIGGWATPGERWRLHKRKTVAGGSDDPADGVDLRFPIKQVSSRHAQFELFPSGDLWVTDLGSSNGTFVNGKKLVVKERAKLVVGDQVKLSQNLVLVVERPGVKVDDEAPAAVTAAVPPAAAEPEPAAKVKQKTKFDPGNR